MKALSIASITCPTLEDAAPLNAFTPSLTTVHVAVHVDVVLRAAHLTPPTSATTQDPFSLQRLQGTDRPATSAWPAAPILPPCHLHSRHSSPSGETSFSALAAPECNILDQRNTKTRPYHRSEFDVISFRLRRSSHEVIVRTGRPPIHRKL